MAFEVGHLCSYKELERIPEVPGGTGYSLITYNTSYNILVCTGWKDLWHSLVVGFLDGGGGRGLLERGEGVGMVRVMGG